MTLFQLTIYKTRFHRKTNSDCLVIVSVMGHRLGAQGPQDQLEGFDQLEIGLDLGQLEIGSDMTGPSLGGQDSSLYKGR